MFVYTRIPREFYDARAQKNYLLSTNMIRFTFSTVAIFVITYTINDDSCARIRVHAQFERVTQDFSILPFSHINQNSINSTNYHF